MGAKSSDKSEMMRRDLHGIVDGEGIKRGEFTELGVTIAAPFVVGAAITPKAAPQSLKTLGGIPEIEAATSLATQAARTAATEAKTATAPKVSRTEPSLKPDATRTPRGIHEEIPTKGNIDSKRGMVKQKETANLLAKKGYDVELQPKITAEDIAREPSLNPDKNPDFRIEGKIFDNLAIKENPMSNPKNLPMNTRNSIADKIVKGQTTRVMLNLDESKLSLQELKQVLLDNPIENLKEIIIMKKGEISHFFPFE
ncbi:MAG: hypothetical protein ACR2F2_10855 [Pyrinomonadaceae bacterium]